MRKVTVIDTRLASPKDFMSDASTLYDFRNEYKEVNFGGMDAYLSTQPQRALNDEDLLPASDVIIYLNPKQQKSGN